MLTSSNDTPTIVRRTDYTPPSFLIDSVSLEFDLIPEQTTVRNTMRVRRNLDAAREASLELVGEKLIFVSAEVGGTPADVLVGEGKLTVKDVPDSFELTLTGVCAQSANTTMMGLYVSGGNFFTQCEAEGFRRITSFLDRPDVMSTYRVTLRADKRPDRDSLKIRRISD